MNKCKNGCIIWGKEAREFRQSWMLLIGAGLGRIVDWWDDYNDSYMSGFTRLSGGSGELYERRVRAYERLKAEDYFMDVEWNAQQLFCSSEYASSELVDWIVRLDLGDIQDCLIMRSSGNRPPCFFLYLRKKRLDLATRWTYNSIILNLRG